MDRAWGQVVMYGLERLLGGASKGLGGFGRLLLLPLSGGVEAGFGSSSFGFGVFFWHRHRHSWLVGLGLVITASCSE